MSPFSGFSRREFLGTLATGGAAAVAGMRAPSLLAQGGTNLSAQAGTKQSLRPSDFLYRGCFKLPPYPFYPSTTLFNANPYCRLTYTTYTMHQAPLAMRVVNGERRFFVIGHNYGGGLVTEVILPSTLSPNLAGAPVASTADFWGSVYGSPIRKASASYPNGNIYSLLTHGLLWDEMRQVLWWSYGDVFDTIGNGPTLGYAKLTTPTGSPSTPASAVAYGPFDVDSVHMSTHNVKGYLLELPPSFRGYVGNRRLAIGGVFDSILGPQQFGPNLIAFDEPQDSSIATALGAYPWTPTNRFVATTADILRYGAGVPNKIDSHGTYDYLTRCRRPADYSVMGLTSPPPAGGAGGTTVNPANGVGWWTNQDLVSGVAWIETANKAGVVFTGGMASGRTWYTYDGYVNGVQIPNDPRGLSGWYGNPPAYNDGRTGTEYFNPGFYIFSPQDLINGATLGYGHYQQDPLQWRHSVGDPIATVSYGAPVYDATTRRLYVLQVNAYPWYTEAVGVIHCWEVLDSGSGVPTAPTNLRIT